MTRWKSFKLLAGQKIGATVAYSLVGVIAAELSEPGDDRFIREIGVFSDRADFLQWVIGIALASGLLAAWCWNKRRVLGCNTARNKIAAQTAFNRSLSQGGKIEGRIAELLKLFFLTLLCIFGSWFLISDMLSQASPFEDYGVGIVGPACSVIMVLMGFTAMIMWIGARRRLAHTRRVSV